MASWEGIYVVSSTHGLFDELDIVLTASWTPVNGIAVASSDLPAPWCSALERLGRDLQVRYFNGVIAHIDFRAMHNREVDVVWL